jgi:hypothetical protein
MSTELEVRQLKRQRARMLRTIRQGHEKQLHHMDDFEIFAFMQDIGMRMSRNQVITMLQDLCIMGYLQFKQVFDDESERMRLYEIELTSVGIALVLRRKSNDEVLFD